jgi:pilus assembly protein Flp/PilA
MTHALEGFTRFLLGEDGPTAVEYAVLLALIVIAAIGAVRALGGGVQGRWEQNASSIIDSMNPNA